MVGDGSCESHSQFSPFPGQGRLSQSGMHGEGLRGWFPSLPGVSPPSISTKALAASCGEGRGAALLQWPFVAQSRALQQGSQGANI